MKTLYSFLFLVSFFASVSQDKTDKLARELKEKLEFKHNYGHNDLIEKKLSQVQLIFDADSIKGFDEEIALGDPSKRHGSD